MVRDIQRWYNFMTGSLKSKYLAFEILHQPGLRDKTNREEEMHLQSERVKN